MAQQENYSDDFLNGKRQLGDLPADSLISEIFADPSLKVAFYNWINQSGDKQTDLFQHQFPTELPAWANRRQMKAGSDFFIRNSEVIMSLLGLLSLPYCYSAADGAMVLYLSQKIRRETTKRLYDTATFVWEVMAPRAFDEGGHGFVEVLKIRLMHATARYHMLKSGQWNKEWGTPVNQEDMAGTNLAFSLIVIRGMRKLGVNVPYDDQQAFMHLWSVIGFLMGLHEDMIPLEPKAAQLMDHAISRRQFRRSVHGEELTQSLIAHIIAVNKSKASANDILGLMKYLLGDDVANMLAIDAPDLPGYKISILKTLNLLKSFKPIINTEFMYHKNYAAFRLQKPVT